MVVFNIPNHVINVDRLVIIEFISYLVYLFMLLFERLIFFVLYNTHNLLKALYVIESSWRVLRYIIIRVIVIVIRIVIRLIIRFIVIWFFVFTNRPSQEISRILSWIILVRLKPVTLYLLHYFIDSIWVKINSAHLIIQLLNFL